MDKDAVEGLIAGLRDLVARLDRDCRADDEDGVVDALEEVSDFAAIADDLLDEIEEANEGDEEE